MPAGIEGAVASHKGPLLGGLRNDRSIDAMTPDQLEDGRLTGAGTARQHDTSSFMHRRAFARHHDSSYPSRRAHTSKNRGTSASVNSVSFNRVRRHLPR
jgi:hypothetical protein